MLERLLHGFKNGLDRHLRLGLGDAGSIHNFVDYVQLDQSSLPTPGTTS
jgi:hypothetical protein